MLEISTGNYNDRIFRGNNRETVITKEKGETEALLVAISTMDVKTRGSRWHVSSSILLFSLLLLPLRGIFQRRNRCSVVNVDNEVESEKKRKRKRGRRKEERITEGLYSTMFDFYFFLFLFRTSRRSE